MHLDCLGLIKRVSLDAFYPSFMKGLSMLGPIDIGIRLYWTGVGLSYVCYKTWIQGAGMRIDLSGKTRFFVFRNSNRNLSVRSLHMGLLGKS